MAESDYEPDNAPRPAIAPEERSFRNSDQYHFLGAPLEPFGFARQTALLGLLDQMGPSPLVEIAAALWLMHQPDSTVHRVRRKPADYTNRVDTFADEKGIVLNGSGLTAAREVYEEICADVSAATGTPILPSGGSGEGGTPDPN